MTDRLQEADVALQEAEHCELPMRARDRVRKARELIEEERSEENDE